jgi:hypothetical protein
MRATPRATRTALSLNAAIQAHIESRLFGEYVWHTGVYLHPADPTGCNWNIAINCKEDVPFCDPVVSGYLDDLRHRFVVAEDDVGTLPSYESDRGRNIEAQRAKDRRTRDVLRRIMATPP